MEKPHQSAIARLVEHHKGPVALSRLLGGSPAYQEVQRWVKRGWASPMHVIGLEPVLPPDITVRDLLADKIAAEPAKVEAGDA